MKHSHAGDSPFLDTATAARYLGGLKKNTLERWRSAGDGPVFYKIGGRCFYKREDLDAYAQSRRRRSTADTRPAPPASVAPITKAPQGDPFGE